MLTYHAMPAHDDAAADTLSRVLVVDDEPGIAELLTDLLEAAGYEVQAVHSGAAALRLLRQQTFDAIVSDLRMPDIDGAALWRQIRSMDPELARRVLFVTGDTLSVGAQTFLSESGCLSLDKPFRRSELLQRMHQLLS